METRLKLQWHDKSRKQPTCCFVLLCLLWVCQTQSDTPPYFKSKYFFQWFSKLEGVAAAAAEQRLRNCSIHITAAALAQLPHSHEPRCCLQGRPDVGLFFIKTKHRHLFQITIKHEISKPGSTLELRLNRLGLHTTTSLSQCLQMLAAVVGI